MSDIHAYEPLWGIWKTTELIGQGSFGSVWRAERTDARGFYSAIKHVALPGSEAEIQALYDEGIVRDERAVDAYYEAMRESLLNEIRFMYAFRDDPNIVTYEDHIAFRHEGAPGYDVFIRMELLKSLGVLSRGMDFTPEQACRLGIDICTALVALKRENVIHRDIKPANILVNDKGVYKLADFGVARRMEKTSMVMSKKGTYAYMSPEVYKGEAAGETADLYSLGLVMHRLLNANRAPFLPLMGNVGVDATEASVARRMNGEEVPYPAYAPPALGRVICKACAYDPKTRFVSPEEFRAVLEGCLYTPEETVAIFAPARKVVQTEPAVSPVFEAIPARAAMCTPVVHPVAEHLLIEQIQVRQAERFSPKPADASGLPYYLRPDVQVEPAKKKRGGKVVATLFGVTAALAAAAFLTLYILAYNKYNEAYALMNEGQYEEATILFSELGGYKDSEEKIQECAQSIKYEQAAALVKDGLYEEAVALYRGLSNYKDSASLASEYESMILALKEARYQKANMLLDNGWYVKCLELFMELGDYKDCKAKVAECEKFLYTINHIVCNYAWGVNLCISSYSGFEDQLYVPLKINGLIVAGIADYTFYYNSELKDIYLPNTITEIGEKAFVNMNSSNHDWFLRFSGFSLTIHCSEGSYAEQYAIDHNIPYVIDLPIE